MVVFDVSFSPRDSSLTHVEGRAVIHKTTAVHKTKKAALYGLPFVKQIY
jgi:hypothetical protein